MSAAPGEGLYSTVETPAVVDQTVATWLHFSPFFGQTRGAGHKPCCLYSSRISPSTKHDVCAGRGTPVDRGSDGMSVSSNKRYWGLK